MRLRLRLLGGMDEMTGSRSVMRFLVVLRGGLSVLLLRRSVRVGSRLRVVRCSMVWSFVMRSLVVLWGSMMRRSMMRRSMMLGGLMGWLVMLRNLLMLHNRL